MAYVFAFVLAILSLAAPQEQDAPFAASQMHDATSVASQQMHDATLVAAQMPGATRPNPGEIPDDRIEVRRRLESFDKLVKDPEKDADATAMLNGMITMFKDSAPRDRGRIQKSIVTCVKLFDAPKDKSKARNLPIHAAEVMAQMGAEAAKPITELLLDSRVGKEMLRVTPLAAGLVKLGLGTPEAFLASINMLDDANPRLYCGLVPAFASYELETQARRKRIAGVILLAHETLASRIEKDKTIPPENKPAFLENGNIGTIESLNALAVQKQPDVAAFKTWFAENKGKEWPEK